MEREPLWKAAATIAALATAIVVLIDPAFELLRALGVPVSVQVQDALAALVRSVVAVLGPLGVAKAVHGSVTPTASPQLEGGTTVDVPNVGPVTLPSAPGDVG